MKGACVLLLAAAAGAGTLSFSRDAHALGPIDIEVGARVGYGTNPTGDTINPLGFGLGGRAGVSIFNVYLGLSGMYYFGEGSGGRSGKSTLYGLDLGYSISLLFLKIRPQIGVGFYNGNFTTPPPSDGDGRNVYLEPGVTVIIPFGIWFAGADANVFVLPGQHGSGAGFTFHGQFGLKF